MFVYLNILKNTVFDNKYTDWYISIIIKAQQRLLTDVYFEKHHILPRSFRMGGETDKANLVNLTAREHLICHKLLVKMCRLPQHKKSMQYGLWRLTTKFTNKWSREYSAIKEDMLHVMSNDTSMLWQDTAYRSKQALSAKTKYKNEEYSLKRSALSKLQMSDPDQLAIAVNTLAKAHENIDHSSSEWLIRSFHSESSVEKRIAKSRTPEARQAASQRELSKGAEILSDIGKKNYQASLEKGISRFGSEEAYRKHLSDRISGRIRIINIHTMKIRYVYELDKLEDGWVVYKEWKLQNKS